ncbi:hypothetical protein HanXRQr2_Chr12g0526331 [Helianthus annuus]|uniref:Uncharacterized protein n=1 Tax=Helianthus annuus TaxID=4232 RepID=A0A9K3EML8_HELAN|nr:hypothetical protein HanXRQr2_Chr12g0526331 [Helianthus annuus]
MVPKKTQLEREPEGSQRGKRSHKKGSYRSPFDKELLSLDKRRGVHSRTAWLDISEDPEVGEHKNIEFSRRCRSPLRPSSPTPLTPSTFIAGHRLIEPSLPLIPSVNHRHRSSQLR